MSMNSFAILDTGHPGVRRAPLHPADCFIESRGLFEGTPEAPFTKKGPWLATMTTYRGFNYRAYAEREFAPHGAATWLATPLSFNATFEHLRSFLRVKTTAGGDALLRFWDGAVFQRLTYVLEPDQLASLVGPFQRWETTTQPAARYAWDARTSTDDWLTPAPLTLSAKQTAMLSLPQLRRVEVKLAREIWHGNPRARAGREPLVVLADVQRAYRHALEALRLSDVRSVAAWVKADAGWARGIRNDQSIVMRARSASDPNLCVDDILSAVKASAKFKGAL
jgi:hypothetical protein